jgi:MraZ protein
MDRFVSHFTNRLDAKGRISIPASFRSVLARDGIEGIFVFPDPDAPMLNAGGHALIGEIDRLIADVPALTGEQDFLAAALYGTSEILKLDPEGRVLLPEALKAHAGIGDSATLVGLGTKFQICEPEHFRAQLAAARTHIRMLRSRPVTERGTAEVSGLPSGAQGRCRAAATGLRASLADWLSIGPCFWRRF